MAVHLIAIGFSLCFLAVLRVYLLLPSRYPRPPAKRACGETCSLGVFLGSGQSSEALNTTDFDWVRLRRPYCRGADATLDSRLWPILAPDIRLMSWRHDVAERNQGAGREQQGLCVGEYWLQRWIPMQDADVQVRRTRYSNYLELGKSDNPSSPQSSQQQSPS